MFLHVDKLWAARFPYELPGSDHRFVLRQLARCRACCTLLWRLIKPYQPCCLDSSSVCFSGHQGTVGFTIAESVCEETKKQNCLVNLFDSSLRSSVLFPPGPTCSLALQLIETSETDTGGYKSASILITGAGAYGKGHKGRENMV